MEKLEKNSQPTSSSNCKVGKITPRNGGLNEVNDPTTIQMYCVTDVFKKSNYNFQQRKRCV